MKKNILLFAVLFILSVHSDESSDIRTLVENILKVHPRPVEIEKGTWESSYFQGSDEEKDAVEKICKQEITDLMKKISDTSDVSILKPLLDNTWVFFNCTDEISAKQKEMPLAINHRVMDFIIENGSREIFEGQQPFSIVEFYVMTMLECRLPDAHVSPLFQEYAIKLLFTRRLRFWYYFLLPKDARDKLQPRLRELSDKLVPDGRHTFAQHEYPLQATACLAYEGDEEAASRLCLYLDHISTENFDLWCAISICALSKQKKVIDKIIHIMKNDLQERNNGGCIIPPVDGPRRAAARALSAIDRNFPSYTDRAMDMKHDPEMDACLEWLKTHTIDLKQPFYPKKFYMTQLGYFN